MPRHLLDEVLDAKAARAKAAAEVPVAPNPVIAWLRSDEGEEWSRSRAMADPQPITIIRPWWRARGPLKRRYDPCGAPPARKPQAPEDAVSTTAIALVAENAVIALGIAAGWHLLRQGGGLQVKTPPVPKRQAPAADAGTVEDMSRRRTGT